MQYDPYAEEGASKGAPSSNGRRGGGDDDDEAAWQHEGLDGAGDDDVDQFLASAAGGDGGGGGDAGVGEGGAEGEGAEADELAPAETRRSRAMLAGLKRIYKEVSGGAAFHPRPPLADDNAWSPERESPIASSARFPPSQRRPTRSAPPAAGAARTLTLSVARPRVLSRSRCRSSLVVSLWVGGCSLDRARAPLPSRGAAGGAAARGARQVRLVLLPGDARGALRRGLRRRADRRVPRPVRPTAAATP